MPSPRAETVQLMGVIIFSTGRKGRGEKGARRAAGGLCLGRRTRVKIDGGKVECTPVSVNTRVRVANVCARDRSSGQ